MQYTNHYSSPLGSLLLAADDEGLVGLWFEGQKYYASKLGADYKEKDLELFDKTKQWLDCYFSGISPDFKPPLHLMGTEFQMRVWNTLLTIPYGRTMSYGQIARHIASEQGLDRMSAQAVGAAVGHNPISIIVPCHRVIGTKGNLTGYAGGIDRKKALLKLEGIDTDSFSSNMPA